MWQYTQLVPFNIDGMVAVFWEEEQRLALLDTYIGNITTFHISVRWKDGGELTEEL